MIPPDANQQQAMMMQRMMAPQGRPEDALLAALSQRAMMGDMLKETATHKMKMLKLKMKYGQGLQQTGPQAPQGGPPPAPGGM